MWSVGRHHISISPISVPKKSHVHSHDLYSLRRCRFRSFRAPMRTALSGSCRSMEVAVLLSPTMIRCGSFCHWRSVYLDVVARESCGRRNSFVPHYFFLPFLESRGPGTALLTVSRLSQWIAGPLHNTSG